MTLLLREPGARLARRTPDHRNVQEFLVLLLAGELYGVPLTSVREILSPPPITPVPRAPREILGVCSVRGLLVTVVDLRRKLRVPETPATRRTRVLLAEAATGEIMGALVDQVEHVVRLADSEIESLSAPLGGTGHETLIGIGRPEGMFVILLDLRATLSGVRG